MTHDELLQELKDMWTLKKSDGAALYALKAVVELHKPFEWSDDDKTIHESCNYCSVISTAIDIPYPCETIQAIEKELS